MAVRIGELLLQEKLITPGQLEEALKYQVIFGGKLGTNLIAGEHEGSATDNGHVNCPLSVADPYHGLVA